MKQVLRFLHSLSLHNDKAWFEAHKNEYLTAKSTIAELAVRLIEGIRSFDDTIGPLSASDCTYRIYRDVRFSKDKSPYKTNMGIYVNRGGKKSGFSTDLNRNKSFGHVELFIFEILMNPAHNGMPQLL